MNISTTPTPIAIICTVSKRAKRVCTVVERTSIRETAHMPSTSSRSHQSKSRKLRKRRMSVTVLSAARAAQQPSVLRPRQVSLPSRPLNPLGHSVRSFRARPYSLLHQFLPPRLSWPARPFQSSLPPSHPRVHLYRSARYQSSRPRHLSCHPALSTPHPLPPAFVSAPQPSPVAGCRPRAASCPRKLQSPGLRAAPGNS